MPVFRPERFILTEDASQVLGVLAAEGKRARVIAGGTGFYELARRGYIPEVKSIVSLMKLGLSYVREEGSSTRIGATTSLRSLLESGKGDAQGLEAIGDAIRQVHLTQIRNVATIGGEVCISVPLVDLPTALLACSASVSVISAKGERTENLDDFYIDTFLTKLRFGEIVKEVIVPTPPPASHSAYVKLGRPSYDSILMMNAAISLVVTADGRVENLRAYVGGTARTPTRALGFEKALIGDRPEAGAIVRAAAAEFEKRDVLPSIHGSKEYKHQIIPLMMKDCFLRAYDRAVGGSPA